MARLNEHHRWKVCDKNDFEEFCAQAHEEGYHWASGEGMLDEETRSIIGSNSFPLYFLIEKNSVYVSGAHGSARDYKPQVVKKPSTGIQITLPNGNQSFFTLDEYEEAMAWLEKVNSQPKFAVGDRVEVICEGQHYDTYHNWFVQNNISVDIASRYAYGGEYEKYSSFIVEAVGKHQREEDGWLYAIRPASGYRKIYLFNEKGLARYTV